jgi:hypothetical protein
VDFNEKRRTKCNELKHDYRTEYNDEDSINPEININNIARFSSNITENLCFNYKDRTVKAVQENIVINCKRSKTDIHCVGKSRDFNVRIHSRYNNHCAVQIYTQPSIYALFLRLFFVLTPLVNLLVHHFLIGGLSFSVQRPLAG